MFKITGIPAFSILPLVYSEAFYSVVIVLEVDMNEAVFWESVGVSGL